MKDIDFDELDKAVNSLMSKGAQKNAPSTPATPPVEKTDIPLTAAPVSPGTIKPKSDVALNPDTQPAVTPQPTSPMQPPVQPRTGVPANRRGGRFMDVVPKKPTSPPRPALRENDQPATRPVASPSMSPSMTFGAPRPEPAKETPVIEKATPVSEWPDPIDMHAAKTPPQEPPKSEPEKEIEKTPDQPLASPFLPDAKVEKRPLGGPSPLTPMIAPEHELMTPTPDDSEAQLPAKPSDVAPETPEEFNDDLMKVEADTHMGVPKTDETHPLSHQPDEPSVDREEMAAPEVPALAEEKDTPQPEPEKDEKIEESPAEPITERASIPQQYKEQPSSGEATSGAIYDTDTYHQPLAHPAKKSSGWWWVLWILLILVVGVGAGMALYFLGIM